MGRFFVQWRYRLLWQWPVFSRRNRETSLLELPAAVPPCILCFSLEARPPAHCLASSAHFLTGVARLRCARDLGSGAARAPAQSGNPSRSTQRASDSLARLSASSFPGARVCAGHRQVSMAMSGPALRSTVMCNGGLRHRCTACTG